MSDSVSINAENGRFVVSGELNVRSVPGLLNQTQGLFKGGDGAIDIDLQQVSRADSSGIAILLEWMRTARRGNRPIHFHNVPPQLQAIAKVSGLDQILPISNATPGKQP